LIESWEICDRCCQEPIFSVIGTKKIQGTQGTELVKDCFFISIVQLESNQNSPSVYPVFIAKLRVAKHNVILL
jgi:hypothetical protein